MCDCISQVSKQLKEKFKEQNPSAEIKEAFFENSALMSERDQYVLELTGLYLIKYTEKSKKGKDLNKKKENHMYFKYCPFCGKKYSESEASE